VHHLSLHCAVVQLFGHWFSLVGVSRVMPCSIFMDYWLAGTGILVGEGLLLFEKKKPNVKNLVGEEQVGV
jgi:hypothetical protein